jgi:RNA polymerase sigma factor (TIGR02999 family)
MNDVTQLLEAVNRGEANAAEQLLPLVYEELRRLAAGYLHQEKPGQTLQPTALVHEAYLRLVGTSQQEEQHWRGRAHFLAAAALAMRHILIDNARRKQRDKRGGRQQRVELADQADPRQDEADQLLALDEALTRLARGRSASGRAGAAAHLRRPVGRGRRQAPGPVARRCLSAVGLRPGLAAQRNDKSLRHLEANGA